MIPAESASGTASGKSGTPLREVLCATREQVLARLREDSSFVLATHEHPDGDALGSLIGMHGLLCALGKQADMFIALSDLPLPIEYRFPALEHAIQEPPGDIAKRTVVLLDCGNIDRNPAGLLRDGEHLLNIDHHHDNTLFGTLNMVDPTASCTAEIVWDLMRGLGVTPDRPTAEALYVGLVTDTGRFMYENTGPRAHEMAAALISAGVDVQGVYRRLYEDLPLPKLELLGLALQRIERFDGGALTLSALSAADFADAGAEESASEGIVDHMRAVHGTRLGVLIRERPHPEPPGKRKVSLRSADDDVDVSAIARTQGGGGHRRAAGFSTTLGVPEIVALLRRELATQLGPAAPVATPV